MWNRGELKAAARFVLKDFYWMAFAITLLTNAVSLMVANATPQPKYEMFSGNPEEVMEFIGNNLVPFVVLYLGIIIVSAVASIFIVSPLFVGVRKFYMEAVEGRVNFSNLIFGFKNRYLNIVKVCFVKTMSIFLWSMLVFLIGYGIGLALLFAEMTELAVAVMVAAVIATCVTLIRKELQLFFVEFLVAENPEATWREILKESKEMTYGDKFSIFVLQLSFLGWNILGMLACIIGAFFVEPYILTTETMLYRVKKGRLMQGFENNYEI